MIWREVTYLPSLPKNGELLIVKSIDIVGSSMAIGGQRFRILVVADRIADFESVDADQGADFTAGHCIDLFLAQTFRKPSTP